MRFELLLRILYRRTRSKLVLDKEFFRKCEGKVVKIWSWKTLKTEKYLVHLTEDEKWNIKKL
ncbi:MAG: hypothetical protein QXO15_08090 [Nitrososphaerota archaeon]